MSYNHDKHNKFDVIHSKITEVDDTLKNIVDQTHKKFAVVKENVIKFYNQINSKLFKNLYFLKFYFNIDKNHFFFF